MGILNKIDDNLRYLLTGALILIILVGMKTTAYLINMIVISLILAMLGTPIFYKLKKIGLSDILSVALIMIIYGIIILSFVFLIFESLNMLIIDLPKYEELFAFRINGLLELLKGFGLSTDFIKEFSPDWGTVSRITIQLAGGISSMMMDGFFIIVITCFLFFEIPALPNRMKKLTGGDDKLTEQMMR